MKKLAEAAELFEMTEMAVDEVQYERIPRRRKRRLESVFYTMNRNVNKQINMGMGNFGDEENNAKMFEIKGNMSQKHFWEQ